MILTLSFLCLASCFCLGQKKDASDKFIEFLNLHQKDSLQNILASDFQLTRTYTDFKNDLNSFLGEYLERSKIFNGKYNIVRTLSVKEPRSFLVEDESDYLRYLKVEFPQWKITIIRNAENKVEQVIFDTTFTYRKYNIEMKSKEKNFSSWLAKHHPEETLDDLQKNISLLLQRAESFSKK